MLAEAETVIELGKDHTIEQMKDLLRWMYVKTFTSSVSLTTLTVAHLKTGT